MLFEDKTKWWKFTGDEAAKNMAHVARQLWTLDQPRRTDLETNLKRFGGKTLRGLYYGREVFLDRKNLRINISKAVTETLTAKVGKNRPRPTVLTDGANWSLRTRAKKMQRWLDGAYAQAEVYAKAPLVFRDAFLCGTGVMETFADVGNMRPQTSRVFPLELLVDPIGGVNGDPQELYRLSHRDRGVLEEMFPEAADAIRSAQQVPSDELPTFLDDSDGSPNMVLVFEAWHLATRTRKGVLVPGRHVIAVSSGVLWEEPWEHDFFPFEFVHWTAPIRGFWGESGVGEIRGLETEVNVLLQSTQKAMKLAGHPWVLSPRAAKVKLDKLTNQTGLVVNYDGMQAPQIAAFQPIHPSVMEQAWSLKAAAYEIVGTNENQASGTKPPGIDSGKALEQLAEDHLVRFETQSRAFEDMIGRRLARQFLRVGKELDDHAKSLGREGYVLKAVANKTVLKIEWSKAQISPDDFFVQSFPTSVLPITPAGRTEQVERWQQNGWVTPQRAAVLLDFPDINADGDVAKADQELLEWQLEQMIDEGKDIVPEPRQNLSNALQWGTYALEKGMVDGTPEENLEKLRTFLNAVDELQAAAQASAQAQMQQQMPPMPPGMPTGAMPPPVAPPGPGAIPGMPPG